MILADGVTYQVELLLKLFICIVDTKLFKAVDVKCFKAEDKGHYVHIKDSKKGLNISENDKCVVSLPINVQNTYKSVLLSWDLKSCIYPVNNTVKKVGIDLLG